MKKLSEKGKILQKELSSRVNDDDTFLYLMLSLMNNGDNDDDNYQHMLDYLRDNPGADESDIMKEEGKMFGFDKVKMIIADEE